MEIKEIQQAINFVGRKWGFVSVISWVFLEEKNFISANNSRKVCLYLGLYWFWKEEIFFRKRKVAAFGERERDATRAQVASSKLALVTTPFVAIYARHYYIEYNKLVLPVRLTYHSSLFIDKFDEGETRATDALVRGRTEVYSRVIILSICA